MSDKEIISAFAFKTGQAIEKIINDRTNDLKEQYIDTHCCINYDGKNLYITSHY